MHVYGTGNLHAGIHVVRYFRWPFTVRSKQASPSQMLPLVYNRGLTCYVDTSFPARYSHCCHEYTFEAGLVKVRDMLLNRYEQLCAGRCGACVLVRRYLMPPLYRHYPESARRSHLPNGWWQKSYAARAGLERTCEADTVTEDPCSIRWMCREN